MNAIGRVLASTLFVFTVTTWTTQAFADEPKVAATAGEHEAMARLYQDKAANYRKEADWHQQMVEAYKKARNTKGRPAHSAAAVKKMATHCAALAKTAAKLAADAEKVAKLHEREAAAMEKTN